MCKKIALCLICVLVLSLTIFTNKTPIFKGYASDFELYLNSPSSSANIVTANAVTFIKYKNVCGESFNVDKNEFDLQKFLSDFCASLIYTEELEHGVSYYLYSKKIKYRTTLFGSIINLHVFVSDSSITIGSPLILGSF